MGAEDTTEEHTYFYDHVWLCPGIIGAPVGQPCPGIIVAMHGKAILTKQRWLGSTLINPAVGRCTYTEKNSEADWLFIGQQDRSTEFVVYIRACPGNRSQLYARSYQEVEYVRGCHCYIKHWLTVIHLEWKLALLGRLDLYLWLLFFFMCWLSQETSSPSFISLITPFSLCVDCGDIRNKGVYWSWDYTIFSAI